MNRLLPALVCAALTALGIVGGLIFAEFLPVVVALLERSALVWTGIGLGSVSVVGFGLGPAIHGRSGIRIALRTRTRRRRAA